MEIEFNITESVEENAGHYFDLAKKAKKKLEGAKQALEDSKKKLEELQKQEEKFYQKEQQKNIKKERKQEWYEKFHFFFSSENFLCIGGKDATSNDIIVKKHSQAGDIVLHTDMAGSPFFIIKDGQKATEKTIQEAAQAVGVYSRAWKLGHTTADIFYVLPEQVTKEAKPGEHLGKGSFMVYGKTKYLHPKLEYAIAFENDQIIAGPITAIEAKTKKFIIIIPGKEKKSALAKKIKSKLGGGDLDDIIRFLPAGGADIING